jgi:hypothetical protein
MSALFHKGQAIQIGDFVTARGTVTGSEVIGTYLGAGKFRGESLIGNKDWRPVPVFTDTVRPWRGQTRLEVR